MNKTQCFLLVLIIFLGILSFRLYFSLKTNNFASDDAYFGFRQTQYITEHTKAMSFDSLSYGGKPIANTSLFYYILAFFSFLMPIKLALKIIPEIFISSLVIIVYLISKKLSKSDIAALLAALMSGFTPLLITNTLNNITEYSLVLPVMFLMFYFLMKAKEDNKYVTYFVILSFILPLLSVSAFVFIFTLIFYIILLVSEGIKLSKIKKEAILFSLFLIFLIEFILFKSIFLVYGAGMIWRNIPQTLLSSYFADINIFMLVYNLGIALLILGVFGIVFGMFTEKNENAFLFIGVILAILLLLLFSLIDLNAGLIFLALSFTILGSLAISKFLKYIKITKFSSSRTFFIILLLVFIIGFSVIPSFISAQNLSVISENEIEAALWLNKNTEKDAVVLADIDEGNLITAVAERKNVLDKNFLLAPNSNERLQDVNTIFITGSEAISLDLFQKYDVDYIYLTQSTRAKYKISGERYFANQLCFDKVVENEKVEIFKLKC